MKVTATCDAPDCEVTRTWQGANSASCMMVIVQAGWSVTGRKTWCPKHNKPAKKIKRQRIQHIKLEDTHVKVPPGTRSEQAYTFKCPWCKAPPGYVCQRQANNYERTISLSPDYLVMDRPHNDRYQVAYKAHGGRITSRMQSALLAEKERLARERWELGRPLREFNQRETEQLREWLRRYGALLTNGD